MKTYIFHRGKVFYSIELKNDKEAISNAEINKGTTKVEDMDGKIIWEKKTKKPCLCDFSDRYWDKNGSKCLKCGKIILEKETEK